MNKEAAAAVTPVRQRTQYTCMATSLMMCLRAHGVDVDEDQVNDVMGARPMRGASWENAFAAAQHFGFRTRLVCPATVAMLKEWTDAGIPVMIAWNPEGRDWSHASVVFDVDAEGNVHVADPNIPDPDQTVRVVPKDEFYKKWFEKWPDYLVRRPAMAVEREVTPDGRQVAASSLKIAAQHPIPAEAVAALDAGLERIPGKYAWIAPGKSFGVEATPKEYLIYKFVPSMAKPPSYDKEKGVLRVGPAWIQNRSHLGYHLGEFNRILHLASKAGTIGDEIDDFVERMENHGEFKYPQDALRRMKIQVAGLARKLWGAGPYVNWEKPIQYPIDGGKPFYKTACDGEPLITDSENEIVDRIMAVSENVHGNFVDLSGALAALEASRRTDRGSPFNLFADVVGEMWPFGMPIDELVRKTGAWRDDIRSKAMPLFDDWFDYGVPDTVEDERARSVAARFLRRKKCP